jgi:ribosome recycling factor
VKTAIQNDEKENVIAEDEKRRMLEQLDKVTTEWNEKIDQIVKEKEEEIMKV